jgi:predicted nucleotidyltransferase
MNTIIQTLQENLPILKAKYPLLYIGVFGSYSRGEENTNSDLDIIYETLPNTFLNLHNYLSLQKDLTQMTNLKIDLVNKKYMNEVVWLNAKKEIFIEQVENSRKLALLFLQLSLFGLIVFIFSQIWRGVRVFKRLAPAKTSNSNRGG